MVIGTPTVLNLIPGGVMKVIHVNQVNENIEIQFRIMNGAQPFNVPEGVSCTIRGTKGDNFGYAADVAVTAGSNIVTVTLTEQLTAVAGAGNIFELVFVGASDDMKVSTENFLLDVERAALGEDTVISDSDLAYADQVLDQLQSVGAVNAQVQQNKANIAAEITRATAAEQTLQQNINAEAAARQAADNTLQSNINAEASSRATTDASLQSQINQLVAPSGSAPSAAEVENARIGSDGTVYPTLGDAIRTQNSLLKSHLENNSQGILNGLLVKGQLSTSGEIGTDTRYFTTLFIYVADVKVLSVTNTSYRECQFYDASYALISRSRPSANTFDLAVPGNAVYFRTSTYKDNLADLKVTRKITSEQYNHIETAWGQTAIIDGNPSQTNTVVDASQIALGYLTASGVTVRYDTAYTTQKIYLHAGDKLTADTGYTIYLGKISENDAYTQVASGNTINISESAYYKINVYDASGTQHEYPSDLMKHLRITNIERAEFDGKVLPGYVKAEADTVLTKLRTHLMNSKVSMFGFNTDQHITNITRLPIINGLRALAYVSKYVPLSFVCLGGDACRSHSNTSLPGNRAEIIDDVVDVYGYAIESNCPVVSIAGNHDYYGDAPSYITQSDMYTAHAKRGIISKNYTEYDDDCNYMIDEFYTNIRYIFANSNIGANADVTTQQRLSRLRSWVSHCLDTIPEGYNAVIISHHCLVSGISISDNSPDIGDLLTPYSDRIICCINGHTHRDGSATKDGILYIATTCAGPSDSHDESTRTYGTADETAEDVFVIDQGNLKIYAIRYGNGSDREFTYTLS